MSAELTPEQRREHYRALRERPVPDRVKLNPIEKDPEVVDIPPDYHLWKPIDRGLQEEGEDLGERLTNDPSLIDRI